MEPAPGRFYLYEPFRTLNVLYLPFSGRTSTLFCRYTAVLLLPPVFHAFHECLPW